MLFPIRFHKVATQALNSTHLVDREVMRARLPVSVIVSVRNEEKNLARCLESLRAAGEIFIVDSSSTDATSEIARSFGVQVVQFRYQGGWPKKRQWALDTLALEHDWVLLLDADESLTPELISEIESAVKDPAIAGYYIGLDMYFLGRRLRHCGATFYKLSLFRRGKGRFECRTPNQDTSMCDMEVHEHVMVEGATTKLRERLVHRNVSNLSRYIQKHDEYSNWEARVWSEPDGDHAQLKPDPFGSQAQRRRWLKQKFFKTPASSVLLFLYRYVFCLGFLDGVPGLIYCGFQAIQFFHVKAKLYEAKVASRSRLGTDVHEMSAQDQNYVRH
jgi:glycosyltransferase involved in cell wall biosynthesis